MADSTARSNDTNSYSNRLKRSLSPDEGEIIEDPKRRRDSRSSPPPGSHNGDGRRHRVVYEGQYSGPRDYYDRDRLSHGRRGYHESRGYRNHDMRTGHRRYNSRDEYRYSSHSREPSRSRQSSVTDTPRDRSISSERREKSPRQRSTSDNRLLSRNSRSPSPKFKQVQFSADAKPPPPYIPDGVAKLTNSAPEPVPIPESIDEDALIEARRKKREAILAKYQGQSTPSLVDNLKLQSAEPSPAPGSPAVRLESPRPASRASTPDFQAGDAKTFEFTAKVAPGGSTDEGPSAADYDPTNDMKLDNERQHQHENADQMDSASYVETKDDDRLVPIPAETPQTESQSPPKEEEQDEEEDDMFATPVSPKTRPKPKEVAKAAPVIAPRQLDASLLDTWHDAEGYYMVVIGELLNNRYVVQSNLGKGMFSGVVRALDNTRNGRPVAIKILRNNEAMRKAGLKEIGILQKIMEADPDGRKHIIRLEGHFDHKGHLCLVFENLSLNLREVLKRFGRDVGISLNAVRAYAQQMFVGLSLLRKVNLMHGDLKPDNILINENRTVLKICDLGSACDISESAITPYLVSRFYRAPEIILGLPYDYAIDTWSIGCTLFELYTGKILFAGRSNNQMLRLMMECRGRFPSKMLRRAQLLSSHFDENLVFLSHEIDNVTGHEVVKKINLQKPVKELKQRVLGSGAVAEADAALLNSFIDFLGRCLELNPEKRITPSEAFKHPFIKV